MSFKYVISAPYRPDKHHMVYVAPSWGHIQDQHLLMQYASGQWDTPHDRVFILPERWLTDAEYEWLTEIAARGGMNQFEQILHWWRVADSYAPRSVSRAKLEALWRIYCAQYFMTHAIEDRRALVPFHLHIAAMGITTEQEID